MPHTEYYKFAMKRTKLAQLEVESMKYRPLPGSDAPAPKSKVVLPKTISVERIIREHAWSLATIDGMLRKNLAELFYKAGVPHLRFL